MGNVSAVGGGISSALSMIPGLGMIAGLPGLFGSLYGLFKGKDDNPYVGELRKLLAANQQQTDENIAKNKKESAGKFSSLISEAANQAGRAGGVMGVSGVGKGLSANVYGKMADARQEEEVKFANNARLMQQQQDAAYRNQFQQLGAQFEQNQAGFLDKMAMLGDYLATPLGQYTIAGIGAGIGSLFKKGSSNKGLNLSALNNANNTLSNARKNLLEQSTQPTIQVGESKASYGTGKYNKQGILNMSIPETIKNPLYQSTTGRELVGKFNLKTPWYLKSKPVSWRNMDYAY